MTSMFKETHELLDEFAKSIGRTEDPETSQLTAKIYELLEHNNKIMKLWFWCNVVNALIILSICYAVLIQGIGWANIFYLVCAALFLYTKKAIERHTQNSQRINALQVRRHALQMREIQKNIDC